MVWIVVSFRPGQMPGKKTDCGGGTTPGPADLRISKNPSNTEPICGSNPQQRTLTHDTGRWGILPPEPKS